MTQGIGKNHWQVLKTNVDTLTQAETAIYFWPRITNAAGDSIYHMYSVSGAPVEPLKGLFFVSQPMAEVFFDSIVGNAKPDDELSGGLLLDEYFARMNDIDTAH